jgi:hypothetical protein
MLFNYYNFFSKKEHMRLETNNIKLELILKLKIKLKYLKIIGNKFSVGYINEGTEILGIITNNILIKNMKISIRNF